jgi:hypothetical protein
MARIFFHGLLKIYALFPNGACCLANIELFSDLTKNFGR